jgi:CelD/BcsL family acetyltransferase involved in cellulose biosynthesis
MLHASVVTQTSQLAELQDEWYDLIARSNTATVFDTFEWQYNWWISFGRKVFGNKLQVVLLKDDAGLLVGLFPFFTKICLIWPLRRLSFLGNGLSDYHDVIAASGYEQAVCDELRPCLDERVNWSFADLNQLREGGLLRTYCGNRYFTGWQKIEIAQEECPFLVFPHSPPSEDRWELLLGQFSKKNRGNIRYYDRALDRIYAVERLVANDDHSVSEALTALFVLHQRRWNQKWLPGVFFSGAAKKFHRRVASALRGRGWLRLHYLRLDGFIEAVLYCFSINGTTYYYQGGFEPSLSRHSLGTVVTALAVKQAAFEGNGKFDFLRGDEPYKSRWTGGKSAWNHRWILAKHAFRLFSLSVAVVRVKLWVERSFKQWMHHRGRPKEDETSTKGNV